jgi:hypothetical protein
MISADGRLAVGPSTRLNTKRPRLGSAQRRRFFIASHPDAQALEAAARCAMASPPIALSATLLFQQKVGLALFSSCFGL